jgi:hypothetical protein
LLSVSLDIINGYLCLPPCPVCWCVPLLCCKPGAGGYGWHWLTAVTTLADCTDRSLCWPPGTAKGRPGSHG